MDLAVCNMKVEDIIEGLNRHIESVRSEREINTKGHIVLHKENTPHQVFKVYKTYIYTLWYINGKKPYRLLTIQQNAKVPENQEESMLRDMDTLLLTTLFNWIGSKSYNEVINGEYGRESTDI